MSSYNLGPDNFEVFSDAEIVWMGEATWTHEVIYIPYATRDGQVGLVARSHSGDRAEFIYLNPSTETEDGVPNVFVFQGVSGDPANDQPVHHYDIGKPTAPVAAAKPRSPQEKFTAAMFRLAHERRLDLVIERNYSNTGHFSFPRHPTRSSLFCGSRSPSSTATPGSAKGGKPGRSAAARRAGLGPTSREATTMP